jgi:hypothetical protein
MSLGSLSQELAAMNRIGVKVIQEKVVKIQNVSKEINGTLEIVL